MNYRLRNNRQEKSVGTIFALGCLLLIFFLFLRFFFSATFSSLAYTIAKPFWGVRDAVVGQSQTIPSHIESSASLIDQNKSLEKQIYDLQVQILELKTETSAPTNDQLKALVQNNKTPIIAKVISKPPFSAFDTFILDRGTSSGILVGDKVYIGTNILVGTIVEVGATYAKVSLFSSGSNSVQVSVQRTGDTIILRGRGGGNFDTTLPKDLDVVTGDTLVETSAHQSVVALVYSVDSSGEGSFKTVYSRLPLNILQTDWVGVEHNSSLSL